MKKKLDLMTFDKEDAALIASSILFDKIKYSEKSSTNFWLPGENQIRRSLGELSAEVIKLQNSFKTEAKPLEKTYQLAKKVYGLRKDIMGNKSGRTDSRAMDSLLIELYKTNHDLKKIWREQVKARLKLDPEKPHGEANVELIRYLDNITERVHKAGGFENFFRQNLEAEDATVLPGNISMKRAANASLRYRLGKLLFKQLKTTSEERAADRTLVETAEKKSSEKIYTSKRSVRTEADVSRKSKFWHYSALKPLSVIAPSLNLIKELEKHTRAAYHMYYSKPYKLGVAREGAPTERIARFDHGIMHTTRVAMYLTAFVNLYRQMGHAEALKVTEEDLQLLQIAALFHDSAREGDAVDLWDKGSAANCYQYLIQIGVKPEKAKRVAEASANKDWSTNGRKLYQELSIEKGQVIWKAVNKSGEKDIYSKFIQNADSLDIMRVRGKEDFEPKFLDFYKEYTATQEDGSTKAMDILDELANDVETLLVAQGDMKGSYETNIKVQHEHENCVQATLDTMQKCLGEKAWLMKLYAGNSLLQGDASLKARAVKAKVANIEPAKFFHATTMDNFIKILASHNIRSSRIRPGIWCSTTPEMGELVVHHKDEQDDEHKELTCGIAFSSELQWHATESRMQNFLFHKTPKNSSYDQYDRNPRVWVGFQGAKNKDEKMLSVVKDNGLELEPIVAYIFFKNMESYEKFREKIKNNPAVIKLIDHLELSGQIVFDVKQINLHSGVGSEPDSPLDLPSHWNLTNWHKG